MELRCLEKLSEGDKKLNKFFDKIGRTTTTSETYFVIMLEYFYAEIYRKTTTREIVFVIPKLQKQRLEDLPEKMKKNCLGDMKANKSPGDNEIKTEIIKLGITELIDVLCKLVWNNIS